jgi:hypothetical protein
MENETAFRLYQAEVLKRMAWKTAYSRKTENIAFFGLKKGNESKQDPSKAAPSFSAVNSDFAFVHIH